MEINNFWSVNKWEVKKNIAHETMQEILTLLEFALSWLSKVNKNNEWYKKTEKRIENISNYLWNPYLKNIKKYDEHFDSQSEEIILNQINITLTNCAFIIWPVNK